MSGPTINELSWKIGGPAGFGIASAGSAFATACMHAGLNAFLLSENPSLIRGGHNFVSVHVAERQVHSHVARTDMLVALDETTAMLHAKDVAKGGCVIYDPEEFPVTVPVGVNAFQIPIKKLCEEHGGLLMRNTVALGAAAGLLSFDATFIESVLKDMFTRKGEAIVKQNTDAFKAGYDYAKKRYPDGSGFSLEKRKATNKVMVSGNDAIALGAVKAGCTFMSAYPMTPATGVFEAMAEMEKDYGLVVRQVEDEIAAVTMAIGASFAGARAMTSTSGGGFCLMTEGLGLAMQTETPIVIVESQRPGPATGMATRTAQGDLRFVLHASTDDGPRIVLAPGDMEECFSLTMRAFDLSEKYQLPAIILVDKFLGMSYATAEAFKGTSAKRHLLSDKDATKLTDYKRYALTKDCISPRTVPGQKGGIHVASSYEHDEYGHESEDEAMRVKMAQKRMCKLDGAAKEISQPEAFGNKKPDILLIGWGSTKGPIREAMLMLEKEGVKAAHLHVSCLSPFPKEAILHAMKSAGKALVIENNQTGQMASLIRENTCMDADCLLKYDGRMFFPEEINRHVLKLMERI